jgi:hypothetical protein
MPYVYILSDYEEDGAENVAATLNRNRLHKLVEENWPTPMEIGAYLDNDMNTPKPYWRQEAHRDQMIKAHSELDELLKKTDEELVANDGKFSLGDGWGGIQLHVVKLK